MRHIFWLTIFIISSLYGKNEIKSVDWSNDQFIVTFEKSVDKVHAWNFYHRDSKQHKYIYDIDNAIVKEGHLNVKDKKFVDSIVIGQYKADKLRISFRNSKELDFDYKVLKNKIIFDFDKKRKNIKMEEAKKSPPTPKKSEIVKYTPKSSVEDRKSKIIVIDPGHGGKDGGAVNKEIKAIEKNIVYHLSKYTAEYLQKMGYTVHLTRGDEFVSLRDRTKFANDKNADLFISIHVNSLPKKGKYYKKNGIETYFLSTERSERAKRIAAKENSGDMNSMSNTGKRNFLTSLSREKIIQSHKLAIDIQANSIKRLRKYYYNIEDGGVKGGPFWVLVGAQMPAVLVEAGYITGDKDGKRLMDRLYKKRLAKGIAIGVEEYFKKN